MREIEGRKQKEEMLETRPGQVSVILRFLEGGGNGCTPISTYIAASYGTWAVIFCKSSTIGLKVALGGGLV